MIGCMLEMGGLSITDWFPLAARRCFFCGQELFAAGASEAVAGKSLGGRLGLTTVLCRACCAELVPIRGRRCPRCGIRLLSELDTCTRCRDRHYAFTAHLSLFPYQGLVREAIHQFKFQKQKAFARLLAHCLAQALREPPADLLPPSFMTINPAALPLVPVPAGTGKKRTKQPGFNPQQGSMQQVCLYLKKYYGFEVYDCLVCLDKAPQKELDFEARLQNVKGRFVYNGSAHRQVPEKVLLVDDIYTTGATASECAAVLSAAGAGAVYAVTLAMD